MSEKPCPMTPDERIERYRRAYAAAHGRECNSAIVYDRGWYRFRNDWRQTGCHRAAKLDEMIQRLEWYASDDYKQFKAGASSRSALKEEQRV